MLNFPLISAIWEYSDTLHTVFYDFPVLCSRYAPFAPIRTENLTWNGWNAVCLKYRFPMAESLTYFVFAWKKTAQFGTKSKNHLTKIQTSSVERGHEFRFRDFYKISIISFFKPQLNIFIKIKSWRIAFYISIPNFGTLGSIVKNLDIFEGPL